QDEGYAGPIGVPYPHRLVIGRSDDALAVGVPRRRGDHVRMEEHAAGNPGAERPARELSPAPRDAGRLDLAQEREHRGGIGCERAAAMRVALRAWRASPCARTASRSARAASRRSLIARSDTATAINESATNAPRVIHWRSCRALAASRSDARRNASSPCTSAP